MESEEVQKLLDYLNGIGFSGDDFADTIRKEINLNAPKFTIPHQISFGEEQMYYNLHFVKDTQFNAYRLQRYHATHRSSVVIEHKVINGIDTAKLEDRMKGQDWNAYFDSQTEIADPMILKSIRETTEILNQLSAGQNFDGIKIQEELMYKYWPAAGYSASDKLDLKVLHEHSRDFSQSEYGICNTNLAYNILSGRLDDLYDKLSVLELDQYPGIDLYPQLEGILSATPGEIYLEYNSSEAEGHIEFTVPAVLVNGNYCVDSYYAIFTPYPAIEHDIHSGIDTAKLEEQMRQIDWHAKENIFVFDKDEAIFPEKVSTILSQIEQLSKAPNASGIADRLMLKYWSDAEFFDTLIIRSAKETLRDAPQREHEFPVDTKAKVAFNLLCGRAAMLVNPESRSTEKQQWARFDFNDQVDDNKYRLGVIPGFTETDLENILNVIPIRNMDYYPIKNALLRGDLVMAHLNNDKKILIEANPEQSTVNLYTPEMRPIPANLHFDPDWVSPLKSENLAIEQKQTYHKYKMPRPVKNRKGKRL